MSKRKRTKSCRHSSRPGKRRRKPRVENIVTAKLTANKRPAEELECVNRFLGLPLERESKSMKSFEVQFRYQDRTEGTVESTVKVDASSLPGAVGKAVREFVKGLDRKQRFDMNKNGLEISAKSVGTATEAPADKSAEAAAG